MDAPPYSTLGSCIRANFGWVGRGCGKVVWLKKTVTVFVEPCFILFYKQTQKKWILFHEHVLITSMMTWFCYWTFELTVVSVWMAMRSSIKVNLVRCEKLLKRKSGSVRGSILEYFTKEVLITFYRFDPITEWISPSIISILIRLTDKMFKKNWDWPKTQALLILNSLRGEPCLKYSCYVLFNHTCHMR